MPTASSGLATAEHRWLKLTIRVCLTILNREEFTRRAAGKGKRVSLFMGTGERQNAVYAGRIVGAVFLGPGVKWPWPFSFSTTDF